MIKIDNEYNINANENCYTLERVSVISDKESKNYGQEVKTIEGYYTTLEGVANGYTKQKIRKYVSKEDENTLKELLDYIKDLEKYLKDKLWKV